MFDFLPQLFRVSAFDLPIPEHPGPSRDSCKVVSFEGMSEDGETEKASIEIGPLESLARSHHPSKNTALTLPIACTKDLCSQLGAFSQHPAPRPDLGFCLGRLAPDLGHCPTILFIATKNVANTC